MSRRGHAAPTSCAAVSCDLKSWASGSYDRDVLVWDAASGDVVRSLSGHTGLINAVAWSPDGERVASASSDHSARIWDAAQGVELKVLIGHTDDVNDVRWSPDGMRIATASFDGTVRVWDTAGRALQVAAHHRSDVNGVAWFPDGRRLAAASDDGTVSVFDAGDGRLRRILDCTESWVDQVAVHPDGRRVASACLDGTVAIFDVETGRRLRTLRDASCAVKAVAWSADGSRLAAASYDGCVRIYGDGDFRLLTVWRAEGLWNRTLAFSANGVATGSFGGGPVELGAAGARQLGSTATHGLNGLAVAPDGVAAVCSDDGRIYEVDLARRALTRIIGRHDAAVLCAAISPDGRRVASGSWDRTVRVWDRATRSCVASWSLGDPVNSVCFDADGQRIWIGTFNGDVLLWDPRHDPRYIGAHVGSVKQVAGNGVLTLSAGRDGQVRSWPDGPGFTTGGSIVNGVAPARHTPRVATVSRRGGLELWSRKGLPLGAFRGHPCSAKDVAWSPCEEFLVAGYYDGALAHWSPTTGVARVEHVSQASISQVAFSGHTLLVTTWDAAGSLHLLDPSGHTTLELAA